MIRKKTYDKNGSRSDRKTMNQRLRRNLKDQEKIRLLLIENPWLKELKNG